jgi:heavy metal sensor kinase
MATTNNRKAGLSIRWRLTIWIALAFAVALGTIFIAVAFATDRILNDEVEDDLSTAFTNVYGRILVRNDVDVVSDYPFPVVIRDPSGVVTSANQEADVEAMGLSDDEIVRIMIEGETIDETVTIRGEEYRMRSGRLRLSDNVRGIAQVASNTQAIHELRQVLTTIVVGGGLIALLVVLAVSFWIARSALRPIEKVTRLAGDIEASDLTRRLDVRANPAEVQRLADTFDAMLARLEDAFGQQRNFVMDVSHELRTPLTALRGNLDVLLMDQSLEPDTRAQLENMSAEVARLIRLTSNLLYLAHAEAGREIARRPVELDSLCSEVVRQARNIRPDVGVRLGTEAPLIVAGDRDLLKQLVLNLVDNGIKYSPAGEDVIISLNQAGSGAEIVVEDKGLGIPKEQLDRIFDRFYQGDSQGSRTVGGAGIGLGISKWIAEAHGGTIRVDSTVGEGTRFVVTLPLAELPATVAATPQ